MSIVLTTPEELRKLISETVNETVFTKPGTRNVAYRPRQTKATH